MKERLQGIIIGAVVATTLTCGVVFAENISKTIDAVYMNVKLVVDGVQIEPKDASGKYVEPFIYNGTTYLPVRAVGQAFNKDVSWDGNTATIYVGGKVDKPAKEVFLYDRPYTECSNVNNFRNFEKEGKNYIGFWMSVDDNKNRKDLGDNRYEASEYVVFPLNGVAKKFKSTLLTGQNGAPETIYKIYNDSGKVLYQSPIMNSTTKPIDIEVDITGCINLKLEITHRNGSDNNDLLLQNPTIITTDYK